MPIAAILSSRPSALVGPPNPDADPVLAPLAGDVERRQGADDPFLERGDEAAQVRAAALEVEHHIDHPLAGPVIGELAAAPGRVHREACLDQLGGLGAGAGGVERRMLDQPDELARSAVGDRRGAGLHDRERGLVGGEPLADLPLHRTQARWRLQPGGDIVARVNHLVTIAW